MNASPVNIQILSLGQLTTVDNNVHVWRLIPSLAANGALILGLTPHHWDASVGDTNKAEPSLVTAIADNTFKVVTSNVGLSRTMDSQFDFNILYTVKIVNKK